MREKKEELSEKITHRRIAEETGVAQSTVSKALSGSEEIPTATVDRVQAAAQRLGYYAQRQARRRKNTRDPYPSVALLMPELVSWRYSTEVTAIAEEVERLGGMVRVLVTGYDSARFRIAVDQLNRTYAADFLISYVPHSIQKNNQIPYLYTATPPDAADPLPLVGWDHGYIRQFVRAFHRAGHTEIALISDRQSVGTVRPFRQAMEELHLAVEEDWIYQSGARLHALGREGVRAMHFRGRMPTAILASYDDVALGALGELRRLGYRIPEDVSLAGSDGNPATEYTTPPLATTVLDAGVFARRIVSRMMRVLAGETALPVQERLPGVLSLRGSIAPPRRKE